VRRLQAQGNKEKQAEALVDTVDRERAAFIKKYFDVDWPDRQVYHAMLNTAAGDEAVVLAIVSFVSAREAA
jgi:cytidylate kinase